MIVEIENQVAGNEKDKVWGGKREKRSRRGKKNIRGQETVCVFIVPAPREKATHEATNGETSLLHTCFFFIFFLSVLSL